jgi:hypothetical protein
MLEMLLAVSMVIQRFDPELVPGMAVSTVHIRFNEGMWMNLEQAPHSGAPPC